MCGRRCALARSFVWRIRTGQASMRRLQPSKSAPQSHQTRTLSGSPKVCFHPRALIMTPTARLILTLAAGALSACARPPAPLPPNPPVAAAAQPAKDDGCGCPAEAPVEPSVRSDIGPDRSARALEKLPEPLALRLRRDLPDHHAACDVVAAGECTIRGDFDGDHLADDAVLVRSAQRQDGIAILWGKGGADLLGGGRHQCWARTEVANLDGTPIPPPCLEPIAADLAWIVRWSLLTRTVEGGAPVLRHAAGRPTSPRRYAAPGSLGDALLLDDGDSALALYRTSSGWTLMRLGF
jgi:hypothetical protein